MFGRPLASLASAGLRGVPFLPPVARRAESGPGADRQRERLRLARILARSGSDSRRRSRSCDVRLALRGTSRSKRCAGRWRSHRGGWLLARLDVRLPIEEPYGQERRVGHVAAILTAPDAEALGARGAGRGGRRTRLGRRSLLRRPWHLQRAGARLSTNACRGGDTRLARFAVGAGAAEHRDARNCAERPRWPSLEVVASSSSVAA